LRPPAIPAYEPVSTSIDELGHGEESFYMGRRFMVSEKIYKPFVSSVGSKNLLR
jgi:hypothetical protein